MGTEDTDDFARWARRIKASDEAAFSQLFHRLYGRLVKFAWRYTKAETTAKDIVQESFVKLWNVRADIDPSRSLRAYMFQIVRNNSLNHLRDNKSDTVALDDAARGTLGSVDYIPEITTAGNERGEQMLQWIDELPSRQKEAIRLSRFEGLDHEEIAYVMDISPRTVNNHIVAALKKLRKMWNDVQTEANENQL